ncbi:hypothetical protein EDC04DRAFT_2907927 [Pisolithus marmoratus]|nr:hypothetical protein EDC04DRAFT_2907927 [Pisolithus marmoratus]
MTYHSRLGEHWDNECGANVSGVLVAESWSKYVAVKANTHMKPFHNKGWEYLEFLEDIFLQGGATGAHAFCAGASNPIISANTDGSNVSSSTPIPLTSISDSIPISNVSVGSPAIISNPPASNPLASNPPTSNPPASTSGEKQLFNMMSANTMDTAAPSPLFSNCHPLASSVSSTPKTKCSQTSLNKTNPQGSSQAVVVVSINNTIQHLGDHVKTGSQQSLGSPRS